MGSLLQWRKAVSTTGTLDTLRFCIFQPSCYPLFKARSHFFLAFQLQLLMQSKKNAVLITCTLDKAGLGRKSHLINSCFLLKEDMKPV